jgi:hypothetical protein
MARVKDSSAIPGEADGGFLTEEQERRVKAFLREREAEDRKAEREQAKERDAAERRQIKEVDAAEKKYRKEKGISPSALVGGYFHMDGSRGSVGGGGMNPTDIEKVPGKRQLKMAKGGSVKSSASKRADGIAQRGKTRGRMV